MSFRQLESRFYFKSKEILKRDRSSAIFQLFGDVTVHQFVTSPVGHAVLKHLQWEADVRQAYLLLTQECSEAQQA